MASERQKNGMAEGFQTFATKGRMICDRPDLTLHTLLSD